jgi:hypothetical protein
MPSWRTTQCTWWRLRRCSMWLGGRGVYKCQCPPPNAAAQQLRLDAHQLHGNAAVANHHDAPRSSQPGGQSSDTVSVPHRHDTPTRGRVHARQSLRLGACREADGVIRDVLDGAVAHGKDPQDLLTVPGRSQHGCVGHSAMLSPLHAPFSPRPRQPQCPGPGECQVGAAALVASPQLGAHRSGSSAPPAARPRAEALWGRTVEDIHLARDPLHVLNALSGPGGTRQGVSGRLGSVGPGWRALALSPGAIRMTSRVSGGSLLASSRRQHTPACGAESRQVCQNTATQHVPATPAPTTTNRICVSSAQTTKTAHRGRKSDGRPKMTPKNRIHSHSGHPLHNL